MAANGVQREQALIVTGGAMLRHALTAFLPAAVLAGLTACAPGPRLPDLSAIYAEAAERPLRNPVVAIPGLLGSRLVDRDSGAVVWGGDDALSVDPMSSDNLALAALPLVKPGGQLNEARDRVRPDGVVRAARPRLFGLNLTLDIYAGLIRTLIAGGYDFRETRAEEITAREQNLDAFEFPYDWRRDVVEAARDLDDFLRRKRDQVVAERLRVLGEAGPPVRFDLVAHSMGALVARYYLMFGAADLPPDGSTPAVTWAGAELVDTAVMIAPPFSGAVTALENLIAGRSFGPLQPWYPPPLLASFPGLHQLLPRDRHRRITTTAEPPLGSLFDAATWEAEGWGLFAPDAGQALDTLLPGVTDPEMRRTLLRAHTAAVLRRAEQFHRAIDQPNAPPPGLELFLAVGGGFETPAGLLWDRETRTLRIDRLDEGDGVVLRASSFADERQGGRALPPGALWSPHAYRSILLLPDEHVELTLNPVFGDNLLFWLLEGERASVRLRPMQDSPIAAMLRGATSALRAP